MAMQRVLAKLSPVLVLSNRDLIPSFTSTITANPANARETQWKDMISSTDLTPLTKSSFAGKRVVIFGEQHQQSQVLRAQMNVLQHLAASSKVIMVMEHFNFTQSALLKRYSDGHISDADFVDEYRLSKEGFKIEVYLPLLQLARELGVPIHGGFPPREWAGVVHKQGLETLLKHEEYARLIPNDIEWSYVTDISTDQKMYIRSLLSGMPPHKLDPQDEGPLSKGILPAQTLKDTFFAYFIDRALQSDVVVFAVCGLGHSEYGINASSRIRNCKQDEIFLIASKEWEAGEFRGDDESATGNELSDMIIPYYRDAQ